MHLNWKEIQEAVAGELNLPESRKETDVIKGLSTDTRTLRPGDLFLALRGENFDGNRFAQNALDRGASGLVLEKAGFSKDSWKTCAEPILLVQDGLQALGDLALAWRKRFSIPVLALTGSNGKTTTRSMVGTFLSQHFRVHQSQGNFNNLIGVPLTLLDLQSQHEVVVLEMGMNHLGEIARLTEIALPTHVLITNVGPVHLEFLKNIETVAKAKGELFLSAPSTAKVLVNLDDPFCAKLADEAHVPSERRVTFGWKNRADIYVEKVESKSLSGNKVWICDQRLGKGQTFMIESPLAGSHNVYNLLAASACALVMGVSGKEIERGGHFIQTVGSRSRILALQDGRQLIDDCYNANVASMKAALGLLHDLKEGNESIAVLGEMLELGEMAPSCHEELGRVAAMHKVEHLLFVGEHALDVERGAMKEGMKQSQVHLFPLAPGKRATDDVIRKIIDKTLEKFVPGSRLLVKGSRGMALERVVQNISEKYPVEKENQR